MNIRKMIKYLERIAEMSGDDQVVQTWCPDGEGWFAATGFVYGGDDKLVRIDNDGEEYDE